MTGIQRSSHGELAGTAELHEDCKAVIENAPGVGSAMEQALARALKRAVKDAPSLYYSDYPQDRRKPEIKIDEAAARLAAAMHLHLD